MSSSGFFPTDPKQLRQRIKSYERKFRQEKKARGDYDNGYGKRFLLGPLYMLSGDLLNQGIGWLAREGKIVCEDKSPGLKLKK